MVYSSGFRTRMVKRMTGPRAMTAGALEAESGVPQPTLSRWLREASTLAQMGARDDKQNNVPKQWTPEERLRVVIEASQLPADKLGELLRREGLHGAQLEEWRRAMLAALAPPRPAKKNTAEQKQIKDLTQELRRKNAALAEVTALLALKKKLQALWGDEDESTPPRSTN